MCNLGPIGAKMGSEIWTDWGSEIWGDWGPGDAEGCEDADSGMRRDPGMWGRAWIMRDHRSGAYMGPCGG